MDQDDEFRKRAYEEVQRIYAADLRSRTLADLLRDPDHDAASDLAMFETLGRLGAEYQEELRLKRLKEQQGPSRGTLGLNNPDHDEASDRAMLETEARLAREAGGAGGAVAGMTASLTRAIDLATLITILWVLWVMARDA